MKVSSDWRYGLPVIQNMTGKASLPVYFLLVFLFHECTFKILHKCLNINMTIT